MAAALKDRLAACVAELEESSGGGASGGRTVDESQSAVLGGKGVVGSSSSGRAEHGGHCPNPSAPLSRYVLFGVPASGHNTDDGRNESSFGFHHHAEHRQRYHNTFPSSRATASRPVSAAQSARSAAQSLAPSSASGGGGQLETRPQSARSGRSTVSAATWRSHTVAFGRTGDATHSPEHTAPSSRPTSAQLHHTLRGAAPSSRPQSARSTVTTASAGSGRQTYR